ncbi:MAG: MBL fold metallo-hydrolase [Syntrophobacterales bacterium]|nr:MBL fold metallo-hydrolase [Syntrophobacterales bacterium]
MRITFFGATREVTGSCCHLSVDGIEILVDCGMHQGKDGDYKNRRAFPFEPRNIGCVFLTHAHIDHSGLLPRLVRQGFEGRIIATPATADLAEIMLYDSAHIQEKDAEWMMRKFRRSGKDEAVEPLYTVDDVEAMMPLFERKNYGETRKLDRGVRCRFTDAGHILGSATLELWFPGLNGDKKIVLSGDIGKKDNPILRDPSHTDRTDYVVVESTYGNRLHRRTEESIDELVEAIETTFARGGNVLIPAFAVGRTQDILYILNKLVRERRIRPLDVYVDSPLAEEATKIYLSYPDYYDEEAMKLFRARRSRALRLHFTKTVEESQRINKIQSGAVIIAGSGMCEGGRIRHHLKHNIWRPECSIIFVGFQAEGTLGRQIVEGAQRVHFLGEDFAVRARVYTIGGFSAHGDQRELLEWLGLFQAKPEVFIVHGEEKSALEFERAVKDKLGLMTHVPYTGNAFDI